MRSTIANLIPDFGRCKNSSVAMATVFGLFAMICWPNLAIAQQVPKMASLALDLDDMTVGGLYIPDGVYTPAQRQILRDSFDGSQPVGSRGELFQVAVAALPEWMQRLETEGNDIRITHDAVDGEPEGVVTTTLVGEPVFADGALWFTLDWSLDIGVVNYTEYVDVNGQVIFEEWSPLTTEATSALAERYLPDPESTDLVAVAAAYNADHEGLQMDVVTTAGTQILALFRPVEPEAYSIIGAIIIGIGIAVAIYLLISLAIAVEGCIETLNRRHAICLSGT